MIITPAQFEDEVNKIMNGNSNKGHDLMILMFETLESLGYGAGIQILKGVHNGNRTGMAGE